MITHLKLEYFMAHENREITFANGINCVKGANEIGKSSIINAISYALFGSKTLRTPLSQAVTWGHDVKKLRVSVQLKQGGETLTFSRGKSGAEVVKNGKVFVTGQNEVGDFAASILGADTATAPKLMFASQNGLRGALEEGPKALSVFIEDLAGFSTFDRILEAASEKLALGSPALLEERLKGAKATLEAATQNMPAKPDAAAVEAQKAELAKQVAEFEASLPDLSKRKTEAAETLRVESQKFLRRREAETRLQSARTQLTNATELIDKLTPDANLVVDESQVEVLRQLIAEADNHESRLVAFRKFRNLPEITAQHLGNQAAFENEAESISSELRKATATRNDLRAHETAWKAKRVDHDKCDKCGQDITHLNNAKEINAQVEVALAEIEKQLAVCDASIEKLETDDKLFSTIRRFAARYNGEVKGIAQFVELDESVYPPIAKWVGSEPSSDAPEAPRAELAKLEADIKAKAAAVSKLEMAVEQRDKFAASVATEEAAISTSDWPLAEQIVTLTDASKQADSDHLVAQGKIIVLNNDIANLQRDFDAAAAIWNSAQARVTDAEKVIAECEADLESLSFNNDLVRKLRAIRPIVANKVWNTVLASVSVMFSQMRGEPSVITKETGGFMCNGQAIESLSGSTLDILGIALRCALLRTFVPQCGLLVLDEPAQGCDSGRTEAMLGFLQGLGMQQTLLITHEEISESVADNIIEL